MAGNNIILRALFWADSNVSDRKPGIACHTGTAYSKTGLTVVKCTFKMFAWSMPA